LGDVATFLNGTSYDKAHVHTAGALPVIRISNISDPSSQYVRTDEVLPDRFMVAAGDLLVSWSASFKSIIWPGPAGLLNQHNFKVTEKVGFDRHFIRHAIEASFEKMQEGVVGIGMMHLRRDAFLSHPIPGIPIALQRHVARYLDAVEKRELRPEDESHEPLAKAMRAVDRIEAIVGKVEEARRLRAEAEDEAEALLSSGIDAIVGDTWPEKSLATVCDAERPITYGIVQAGEHIPDGVPYIRVSDMAKPQLSPIGMLRTSGDIAARYRRSAVRHGDIVFAIRATIGKMRLVPESLDGANLTQGTARIAAGTDAMTEYLYWVLQGRRVADRIQAATKGSTFREITLGRLRNIKVPVPSLAIQTEVIERCRNLADLVGRLRTTQSDSAITIGALVPAVLDQAFRGEM
jgi:type I restriction enzyme S subunit